MQEGSNLEAIMFASHHGLDNLVGIIYYNNLQSLTTVSETLDINPLEKKLKYFGWHVINIDGHNHKLMKICFEKIKTIKNKPTMVIANTVKGKGISFMENRVEWHYKSPNDVEKQKAIKEIMNAKYSDK